MVSSVVELRNIAGTEAALGWAGGHTLVVDRAEGRAGGSGLGFNGGQLLALAIGGCFCNDLRYAAHELGVALDEIAVTVTLELDGVPLVATSAAVAVHCSDAGGRMTREVIDKAQAICTVANSVKTGFPVVFRPMG